MQHDRRSPWERWARGFWVQWLEAKEAERRAKARPKLLVPPRLEAMNPTIYRMALGAASQQQADRFIRAVIPTWMGAFHAQEDVEPDGWCRTDRPVNGEWSLNACQGGAKYNVVTKDKRGTLRPGEHNVLRARVEVEARPEPRRPDLPKGTRRLAGNNGGLVMPR